MNNKYKKKKLNTFARIIKCRDVIRSFVSQADGNGCAVASATFERNGEGIAGLEGLLGFDPT